MKVGYRSDRDRHIVELWLGGMSMTNIGAAIHRRPGIVRDVLLRYCDQERVYSRDGRSWFYRILRRIHPNAPLSDIDRGFLFPLPEYRGDEDDHGHSRIAAVLKAADAFNAAVEVLERGDPVDTYKHEHHRHRVVMQVLDGRLYVAVAPVKGSRND